MLPILHTGSIPPRPDGRYPDWVASDSFWPPAARHSLMGSTPFAAVVHSASDIWRSRLLKTTDFPDLRIPSTVKIPVHFSLLGKGMGKLRFGYARVSTDDQTTALQADALKQAGCSRVYEDKASGKASVARPQLEECLADLREGDTLVVWRLDRLGRSLPDLVRIVTELEQKGVAFESLTERIETSSASGKLIFHVFAALAEFERNLIRERTKAGLAAARVRGRVGGRKPKLDAKQIRQIKTLLRDRNTSVTELAKDYGVSRTTIYKHCGVVAPSELIEGTT